MNTGAGAVTVAATDQQLAKLSASEPKDGVHVYYCTAKRVLENFKWQCVKLDFDPVPDPAPVVGADLVVPLVTSLLASERARLPPEDRRCFFCAETVALDNEYFVWHHRAAGWHHSTEELVPPNLHLVVVAHLCNLARCKEEKEAWTTTVRAKPPAQMLNYWCAQCLSVAEPGTKYLACGHCLAVNYCSKACQRRHWSAHRAFCESVERKTK